MAFIRMSMFDSLLGGGTAGQLKRHGRRVANRDAQPEDREQSALWLSEHATGESLFALCGRFGLQLEHSLKDQKEKEQVLDLLVGHGAPAATVVRQYARTTPSFQWPVKVVDRVEGFPAGTELLLELLAAEKVEEEFRPEKKRALLITLAERVDPRIVAAAERFLGDYDEGVRNGAVEAMAAQGGDAARKPLLVALKDPREESTRIRGRIAEIFAQRRWPVEDDDGTFATRVPGGFRLSDGRLQSLR